MPLVGTYIAPMMIFPKKNMKNLIDEAHPGTLGIAQQSGWITTDISEMDKTFSKF